MTVQHNLPDGKVKFLGEFKLQKNYNQSYSSNIFSWLLEMTFENDFCLLHGQAATFFAPCILHAPPTLSPIVILLKWSR